MKKLHIIGLALLAVFAFSAVAAASASAEVALWLVDGKDIEGAESYTVTTTGSLLLVSKALGATVEVLCEGELDGTIGPEGKDEITELLEKGRLIPAALEGTGLMCTVTSGSVLACKTGELVEVWADNLPWPTQLELMAEGPEEYLDLWGSATKLPGYHILCANGIEQLCVSLVSASVKNNEASKDVDGLIADTPSEECDLGSGLVESDEGVPGLTFLTGAAEGKTLSVSMP